MEGYTDDGGLGDGGSGTGSKSDDDDTLGLHADLGEGSMCLEADAGTILNIAGDAGVAMATTAKAVQVARMAWTSASVVDAPAATPGMYRKSRGRW